MLFQLFNTPRQIVDLMVRAGVSDGAGRKGLSSRRDGDGADTFAIIAKAYRRQKRQHLTLHLCEAFEERTGQPLVPSTPQGLILLLNAMQPKTARHARRPGSSSSQRGDPGGEKAVKELLRRYEEGGKVGSACLDGDVDVDGESDCRRSKWLWFDRVFSSCWCQIRCVRHVWHTSVHIRRQIRTSPPR